MILRRNLLIFGVGLVCLGPLAAVATARDVYVTTPGTDTVAKIDTATNSPTGTPIAVGDFPTSIAISPNGSKAYTGNTGSNNITVIDTASASSLGPAPSGGTPRGIGLSPDGTRAYIAESTTEHVQVLDTVNGTLLGSPLGSNDPRSVVVSPDGSRAYVAQCGAGSILVINTSTNTAVGSPITVGTCPVDVALSPDGRRLYVVNNSATGSVSVIDTATNGVIATMGVGAFPQAIAVTPDGTRAYVPNVNSNTVSVLDLTNNTALPPVAVGVRPIDAAVTPDGAHVYVPNETPQNVSVIDTATNTVSATITLGNTPERVAVAPNQPPVAVLSHGPAEVGSATNFDASGSSDPDGSVATYVWDFGDGTTATTATPTTTHSYAATGAYTARLTTIDNEGCSTTFVQTGQTASCNGKATAATTSAVTVSADKTAPQTQIQGKPKKTIKGSKVTFKFSSEPGASFACSLDGSKAKGCTSPKTYRRLKRGKHVFKVAASDAAGNADASPGVVKFKVKPNPKKGR